MWYPCHEIKRMNGIRYWCEKVGELEFPHEHKFVVMPLTLVYDGPTADIPADCVDYVRDTLNAEDAPDGYEYDGKQVRLAMWRVLNEKIEAMLENIENVCLDTRNFKKYLGEPAIDLAAELRAAEGDHLRDMARDEALNG